MFYGFLIALTSIVAGMVLASKLGLAPMSFASSLTVPATNSAPLVGPLDATTFRTIAQEASPTVVSIRTTETVQGGGIEDFLGLQNPFRGEAPQRRQQQPPQIRSGQGSGFIIDKNGFILTNNHVVEDATTIEVKLSDMDVLGAWLPAKVVGTDLLTDIALIQLTRLPGHPLQVSRFGDSAQIAQGDWVMAIGNPFSLGNTVTVGIVSAVGRQQRTAVTERYEEMIQTDAAINRGNSGGPLLNVRGEVVGINTQILSEGGGNLGIGFAVPINTVRNILPQLEKGKVVRGRIGVRVSMAPMTKEDAEDLGLSNVGGAEITDVGDGGPAKAAGMRVGDIVVEFNGRPVKNSGELVSMVTATAPGTTVPVKLVRAKKTLTMNVKVDELDVQAEQTSQGPTRPEPRGEQPKDTGFGMSIEGLTPNLARRLSVPSGNGGAIVSDVEPQSAAAQGGLRPGDVILQINGAPVSSVAQVSKALDAIQAGRTARIVVWREGQEQLALVRKR